MIAAQLRRSRLRFAEGELTVIAQTQDVGESRESMPAAFTGDPLEIGFNADFLRDGLESIDGDDVRVKLISPLRPAVLQGDSDDFTYLIMPIRLAGLIAAQRLAAQLPLVRAARARALQPGLVLAVGPNGAGKTNLLESLHVGTQGFSPRTRTDAQLIRFGESSGADQREGPPRRRPARAGSRARDRSGEAGEAQRRARCAAPSSSAASCDARLHARPARDRQGRARRAARLLRPRCSAGSRRRARSCRPDYGAALGAAKCGAAPGAARPLARDALEPWTEQVAELGAELVAARREVLGAPRAGLRRARRRARARRGGAALRRRAPTVGRARAHGSTRDLERGATGLGPAPRRRRRSRAATASCAASARRASSGSRCSRCSSPRPSCSPTGAGAAAAPARRRALRARPGPAADPRRRVGAGRPGADHGDGRCDAARRAGAARGGAPAWTGRLSEMDPLGDELA